MTQSSFGIHWFRRDLRIGGNAALLHNWKVHQGRVLGVFFFDSVFLSRPDFSNNRFAFFIKALKSLQKEMRERGGDLLVIDELAVSAFPKVFEQLGQKPSLLTWNRDYEPFARERDQKVSDLMTSLKVPVETFRDHLIIEPQELFKLEPGDFYQVYSPFAKKWFDISTQKEIWSRVTSQATGLKYLQTPPDKPLFSMKWSDFKTLKYKDSLDDFQKKNDPHVTIPVPEASSQLAFKALQEFSKKISNYKEHRDIPSLSGTSKMSLFLKNGTITSAQIVHFLSLENKNYKLENSENRYLKEIVWREFYYHILYHRPDVEKQAFLEKYREIRWPNDESLFRRWCEGTTGYPIVDAGMRELNTTGWMHNRVRMIVASFLCKDLLIDWRWGENYFMKMLLDGDIAPNNGGWQWAASTGCDPQPYFRIFNPWLQSAKFDPQGIYIKTYIPELKDVPIKALHDPEGDRGPRYPQPIVDHASQKPKALKLYKSDT